MRQGDAAGRGGDRRRQILRLTHTHHAHDSDRHPARRARGSCRRAGPRALQAARRRPGGGCQGVSRGREAGAAAGLAGTGRAHHPHAPSRRQRRAAARQHLRRHRRHARQRQRRLGRDRQDRPRPRRRRRARAAAAGAGRGHRAQRTRRSQGPATPRARRCGATIAATSTSRSRYNVTAPAGIRHPRVVHLGVDHHQGLKGEVSAESVSGTVPDVQRRADRLGEVDLRQRRSRTTRTSTAASAPPAPAAACCCGASRPGSSTLGSISGNVVLDDVDCQQVEAQIGQRQREVRRAGRQRRPLRAQLALRQRHASRSAARPDSRSRPPPSAARSAPTSRSPRAADQGAAVAEARSAASMATAARSSSSPPSPAASSSRSGRPPVGNTGRLCIELEAPAAVAHTPANLCLSQLAFSLLDAELARSAAIRAYNAENGSGPADVEEIVAMKKQWVLVCVLAGALMGSDAAAQHKAPNTSLPPPKRPRRRRPARHDARHGAASARRDRRRQAARRRHV